MQRAALMLPNQTALQLHTAEASSLSHRVPPTRVLAAATSKKFFSTEMLVDASLLAARHKASKVVSGSVCRGSVRESEMSVCMCGREERWRSTHRPPLEMVTLS